MFLIKRKRVILVLFQGVTQRPAPAAPVVPFGPVSYNDMQFKVQLQWCKVQLQ